MAKQRETKVLNDEYNGYPVFKVFEVDGEGDPIDPKKPVVSFGMKKGKAILKHVDELEKFVEENN